MPDVTAEDHIRGPEDAPLLIEYADFECPFCAALTVELDRLELPFRHVLRQFPVKARHPRAMPAAYAAEAAGLQDQFWEMYGLLFGDQARIEDPHLWERAERLGLDLERFESDRRSETVRARVQRDFLSGVRAGVVSTPSVFVAGQQLSGRIDGQMLSPLLA